MHLQELQLTNFRSYSQKEFSFSPEVTVIVGPNASGKTNLLEAIYLLSSGRSFRAGVEREMIRSGEEVARIQGVVEGELERRVLDVRSAKGDVDVLNSRSLEVGKEKYLTSRNQIRRSLIKNSTSKISHLSHHTSRLEIFLTSGSVLGKKAPYKRLLVNGVGRRFSDFVGNLPAVLFWPEDLELVTDSPSLRRRYLDMVLSQVDREYRRAVLAYEKALRVRNKLLQDLRKDYTLHAAACKVYTRSREGMEYWEEILVEKGALITKKREEFMEFLNKKDRHNPYAIATNIWLSFEIKYLKNEISHQRLREYGEKEMVVGMTLVGPHRDDFVVKLKAQSSKLKTSSKLKAQNEKNLSVYGSRGEQRLGVLWLKLGEMEFVREKLGVRPILLLDDILSELDDKHRRLVLEIVPKQQTIITTADWHFLERSFLEEAEVIKI